MQRDQPTADSHRCSVALRRSLSEDHGSQIVEFAVSLPLLVVLVVGIFDFGSAFTLKQKLAYAALEGARVGSEELRHRTILTAKRTASNRGSMLQDLDRGRRTEIDAITGAIVRTASKHGIPVPLNQALSAIVKAREGSTRSAS